MRLTLDTGSLQEDQRPWNSWHLQTEKKHSQIPATTTVGLLNLPFLPAELIPQTFKQYADLLLPLHNDKLHSLVAYIENTYINGSVYDLSSWSTFGISVRTNNDVDGWHHHLNRLCTGSGKVNVNLYQLTEVLHKEAT